MIYLRVQLSISHENLGVLLRKRKNNFSLFFNISEKVLIFHQPNYQKAQLHHRLYVHVKYQEPKFESVKDMVRKLLVYARPPARPPAKMCEFDYSISLGIPERHI